MPNDEAEAKAAREAHRAQAFDRVEHVRLSNLFSDAEVKDAVDRLSSRLDSGDWDRNRYLRPVSRRSRETPPEAAGTPRLSCDLPELAIVSLLARTAPESQFSVTPQGDVFAGDLFGHHYENERFYVTALTPILDGAADLLLAASGQAGGRMYVHLSPERKVIERAGGRSVLAEIDVH